MGQGRTGAVRQNALSAAQLNAQEKHGKRQDKMGKARRVREVPPLVYGSLELAKAREDHMANVQQQQGQTAALHILLQFPTETRATTEKSQEAMLKAAVDFANEYHGGDAVFAARLDRDEKGRHTVDVFAMPKYDFTYKDGRTVKRAAVSKFSKEHAKRRHAELSDPDEKLEPGSPIMQGRAMQAAWFEFLRDRANLRWVEPPERKKVRTKDRLEPEAYGLAKDRARLDAEKAVVAARCEEVQKKEAAVSKAARVVATAKRLSGRPVEPELAAVVEKAKARPGPPPRGL